MLDILPHWRILVFGLSFFSSCVLVSPWPTLTCWLLWINHDLLIARRSGHFPVLILLLFLFDAGLSFVRFAISFASLTPYQLPATPWLQFSLPNILTWMFHRHLEHILPQTINFPQIMHSLLHLLSLSQLLGIPAIQEPGLETWESLIPDF